LVDLECSLGLSGCACPLHLPSCMQAQEQELHFPVCNRQFQHYLTGTPTLAWDEQQATQSTRGGMLRWRRSLCFPEWRSGKFQALRLCSLSALKLVHVGRLSATGRHLLVVLRSRYNRAQLARAKCAFGALLRPGQQTYGAL
jgi:hypothetical protein